MPKPNLRVIETVAANDTKLAARRVRSITTLHPMAMLGVALAVGGIIVWLIARIF